VINCSKHTQKIKKTNQQPKKKKIKKIPIKTKHEPNPPNKPYQQPKNHHPSNQSNHTTKPFNTWKQNKEY